MLFFICKGQVSVLLRSSVGSAEVMCMSSMVLLTVCSGWLHGSCYADFFCLCFLKNKLQFLRAHSCYAEVKFPFTRGHICLHCTCCIFVITFLPLGWTGVAFLVTFYGGRRLRRLLHFLWQLESCHKKCRGIWKNDQRSGGNYCSNETQCDI